MGGRLMMVLAILALPITPAAALDCKSETLSQADLTACAHDAFEAEDARLNARYRTITGCLKGEAQPLVEAQRAWLRYRDLECKFQGAGSAGGTIQPMVIAGCLQQVTQARAKALDFYLTCEEGDAACPTAACGFSKPAGK